ncbi:Transposase IS4 [Popillia japonica]|uniref:Transposase IS4 n=1 Tax=Popillia japonica TaxID=7064 RepID=A0AAW1J2J0_POPJA
MWHIFNNDNCEEGEIQSLADALIKHYQDIYAPGQVICIDESLIPFQGRLVIKQYIPEKSHKYGVKIFKLCCGKGYTWNLQIYAGKQRDKGASVPTNLVMNLSKDLLDAGRTIVTYNYYTSVELANRLLDRGTHLVGTLRSNRKGNPREVTGRKLNRAKYMAKKMKGVFVW